MSLWNVRPQGFPFASWLSGLNLPLAGLAIQGASTFRALLRASS